MGGMTLAAAAVAIFAMSSPVLAQQPDGVVTAIPYTTCDGSRWTDRWVGDNFHHQPERGAGHGDDHIDYRTWGGACWSARWDAGGARFQHTPKSGGQGHPDTILNFTDWDGAAWTTYRAAGGWYVKRR